MEEGNGERMRITAKLFCLPGLPLSSTFNSSGFHGRLASLVCPGVSPFSPSSCLVHLLSLSSWFSPILNLLVYLTHSGSMDSPLSFSPLPELDLNYPLSYISPFWHLSSGLGSLSFLAKCSFTYSFKKLTNI